MYRLVLHGLISTIPLNPVNNIVYSPLLVSSKKTEICQLASVHTSSTILQLQTKAYHPHKETETTTIEKAKK